MRAPREGPPPVPRPCVFWRPPRAPGGRQSGSGWFLGVSSAKCSPQRRPGRIEPREIRMQERSRDPIALASLITAAFLRSPKLTRPNSALMKPRTKLSARSAMRRTFSCILLNDHGAKPRQCSVSLARTPGCLDKANLLHDALATVCQDSMRAPELLPVSDGRLRVMRAPHRVAPRASAPALLSRMCPPRARSVETRPSPCVIPSSLA